ncbi:hypothetical protein GQ457_08G010720 [Hibiscus cannabinus]
MSIRMHAEKTGNQAFLNLIPLLQVVNVGLIFTKGDLKEVSEEVAKSSTFQPRLTRVLLKSSQLWSLSRRVTRLALLAKHGIRPFSYGLIVPSVYDNGSVFSPEVLDLTEEDLIEKFATGVSMVTALSNAISYPTLAAAPHMFINAYKNVLSSFPQADKVKEYLADPSKFAVAAADAGAAAVEEKKPELEEEFDDNMGFSLFD